MPEELIYIQFSRLDDLVKLVALSPGSFIQHVAVEGKHIYFIQSLMMTSKPMVYIFRSKEKIEKNYVVYNRFSDEITFSAQPGQDGQSIYIPILEVERTNILKQLP